MREKPLFAPSWLTAWKQLITVSVSRQALPISWRCVICNQAVSGRCLDCGASHFLCEDHFKIIHAEGRSLHNLEVWEVRDDFDHCHVIHIDQVVRKASICQ